jgi:hypothetical protein
LWFEEVIVDVGVEMEVDGIGMPRGHGIYSVSTHAYVRDRTLLPHGAVATSSHLSGAPCWVAGFLASKSSC